MGMKQVDISNQLAQIDRELWLVTAGAGSRRGGLISSTVSRASIVAEVPRICLNLARQHFTWELVEASNTFAVHLLGEEHLEWIWRFGTQSGRTLDKFHDLSVGAGQTGSPLLFDALAWFECRVEARLDTGDGHIDLADVLVGEQRLARPLVT